MLYPFGLSLALLGFQQVSGIDTVIFYTVEIFKTAESNIDEYLSTILIGLVQLVRVWCFCRMTNCCLYLHEVWPNHSPWRSEVRGQLCLLGLA